MKTYNLGTSSQTPIQSELLLKYYLDKMNPKNVIFEVNPLTFYLDGLESTLDIITNQKNDLSSINMTLKYNNAKAINTLAYGIYQDIFGKENKILKNYEKEEGKYIPGGYVEKKITYYKKIEHKKTILEPNNKQYKSFNRIIKLLTDRKINVVLVQAPITKSLYHSYANAKQFDDKIQKYGEYYNFNKILNLNDSLYFYDSDHLNQNGVKIFNEKLIQKLLQKKIIN